jgi:uncharacterized membrane protein
MHASTRRRWFTGIYQAFYTKNTHTAVQLVVVVLMTFFTYTISHILSQITTHTHTHTHTHTIIIIIILLLLFYLPVTGGMEGKRVEQSGIFYIACKGWVDQPMVLLWYYVSRTAQKTKTYVESLKNTVDNMNNGVKNLLWYQQNNNMNNDVKNLPWYQSVSHLNKK